MTLNERNNLGVSQTGGPAAGTAPGAALTINADRPLSPRSLALSVLLGSHPPVLPIRAFVRLAEEFGIAPGAMRTALSRLAANGDVIVEDGRYRLGSAFASRQLSQDLAREAPVLARDTDWNREWHTIVTTDEQRSQVDRRRFRTTMTDAHFGSLRPDIWMRPANLPSTPPVDKGWLCTTGPIDGTDELVLIGRLWPLTDLSTTARAVTAELRRARGSASSSASSTRDLFAVSAMALRCLRHDPLLPPALAPAGWPMDELRHEYGLAEALLQARLRALFAADHTS